MALKIGIVGLPNVGKSTIFNALSQQQVASENFPFCTIEPNVGCVPLSDQRLAQLQECVQAKAVIPTTISFVDIAGLVKGASEGEGLGNKFLGHIREVDAIVHVVRCFDDNRIIHVSGEVDPVFDQEVINEELRLADLATLIKRRQKSEKKAKSGIKEAMEETLLLNQFILHLEENTHTRHIQIPLHLQHIVAQWQLLTRKPIIYVANIDEATLQEGENDHLKKLRTAVASSDTIVLPICINLEAQIISLPEGERQDYLEMYGLKETSLTLLIQAAYRLLGLITYFTAGPKEVRAWPIPKGALAPQAAGVIHSDFEQNFIKAEVIHFDDYISYRTVEACRQAGKVMIEGKNYTVQDGDVIHFRHGA